MSERDGDSGAAIDGERDALGAFDASPVAERDDLALVTGSADVDDLDRFLEALSAIGDDHGCVVQAFDAGLVAGERHLARAADCARRAIDRGEAIARDPAVEVLCYAAGRRQIEAALELGIAEGSGQPAVVLVAALGDEVVEDGSDAEGTGGEGADAAGAGGDDAGVDGSDAGAATAVEGAAAAVDGAADAVRELLESATLDRGSELADPERLAAYFDVTDAEREASDADLETLVCERVALLVVER